MDNKVIIGLKIENDNLKREIEELKKIISMYDTDATGKVTKEWVKLLVEGKLKFVE